MNELIKIETRQIAGATIQTCNARDLWQFVESKAQFADWIKGRIEKYGFVEGEDFTVQKFVNGRSTIIDYHLAIETAKELAMVENNDKGREVRRYFIECERRAKSVDPMQILSDPAAMRGLLLGYTEKVLELESTVAAQAPKVEAFDRIATFSEGAMCITDAAKHLQLQPKKLFLWLQENKWIYRRPGSSGWKAHQCKMPSLLEHKITTVERADGSEKVCEQVLVTAKGLAKLSSLFSAERGVA